MTTRRPRQFVEAVNKKGNVVKLPCARAHSNASKLYAVFAKQCSTQCLVVRREESREREKRKERKRKRKRGGEEESKGEKEGRERETKKEYERKKKRQSEKYAHTYTTHYTHARQTTDRDLECQRNEKTGDCLDMCFSDNRP